MMNDINSLKAASLYIESLNDRNAYSPEALDRLRMAVDHAEYALEKQQPKKIICKKGWLSCPTCNACLSKEYGYGKYCEDCGQRLE